MRRRDPDVVIHVQDSSFRLHKVFVFLFLFFNLYIVFRGRF